MVEGRRGLGRGLSALLEEAHGVTTWEGGPGGVTSLPIDLIRPNPDQPRKHFDQTELDELALSIGQRGVIQPILLRPHPTAEGDYEIVAGERRWRAARQAGLSSIPALIRDLTALEVMEIALIENIQRSDLSVLEEARVYLAMSESFGRSAEEIAKVVGRSRSHVANTLRLLRLPEEILDHLNEGRLTAGHARALLDQDDAIGLAQRVVARGLNVRQTEALAREGRVAGAPGRVVRAKGKDADTRAVESDLSEVLGMEVDIMDSGGAGTLTVHYSDLEQLDELCRRLLSRPSRGH